MKERIAYVPIHEIKNITQEHASLFTRINLAFATLNDQGQCVLREDAGMDGLTQVRSYNPNIKIIMSIGGAGAFGFSDMAMTKESRQVFLDSMVEMIKKHNLDGVDLDWEFPTADWGGDWDPKDKPNYTLLLKEMRQRLDLLEKEIFKKQYLTIAAGVGQWFIATTEVAKYKDYLDEFMLMTYDLRGFGQQVTGHHTTLYQKEADVIGMSAHQGVKLLLDEGVPREKIVIGFAMYSKLWEEVKSENDGLLQKSKKDSGKHFLQYPELQTDIIDNPEFENFWDDEAKVPWSYSEKLRQFVSYDNRQSVEEKINYIKDHDLGGLMFWRYVNWPDNPLIDAMKELKSEERS